MAFTKRGRRRAAAMHYLLTGEQQWERFEATVIVAKSARDMAEAEAALVAECAQAGRSIESVGNACDEVDVRVYRVGSI